MYAFEFTLSEEEYLDFNIYHVYYSPVNRQNAVVARFLYPVLFMIFAFLSGILLDDPIFSYAAFTTLSVVWIVFFFKITNWLVKRNILKLKKKGKLPYHQDTTLRFEDEAIKEHTENGNLEIKYSALEYIGLDKNAVYLYFSVTQAFILPLRVFKNDAQQKEFLDFINEKTDGKVNSNLKPKG